MSCLVYVAALCLLIHQCCCCLVRIQWSLLLNILSCSLKKPGCNSSCATCCLSCRLWHVLFSPRQLNSEKPWHPQMYYHLRYYLPGAVQSLQGLVLFPLRDSIDHVVSLREAQPLRRVSEGPLGVREVAGFVLSCRVFKLHGVTCAR